MFPYPYKYYVVDYKLIVEHNKTYTVFYSILFLVLPVIIIIYSYITKNDPSGINYFLSVVWILVVLYQIYKVYHDPIVLEVDDQNKTILLKNKIQLAYKDVLWIEISPVVDHYTYDYLKLILEYNRYEKVFRASNSFFSPDDFASNVATQMSKWIGKEFKEKA
jgi:hypothetical protein